MAHEIKTILMKDVSYCISMVQELNFNGCMLHLIRKRGENMDEVISFEPLLTY